MAFPTITKEQMLHAIDKCKGSRKVFDTLINKAIDDNAKKQDVKTKK